jgi:hypothetical protein
MGKGYKRKFDGPTVQERKHVDQDPLKVPPHKKERKYTLEVEWTETTTWRRTRDFTSRAARDEARRRIERHFREVTEKEKAKKPTPYRWWRESPFADYDDLKVTRIKTEPAYSESSAD